MSSILKVDQIQLADGSTPTAADLGLNIGGNVINVEQRSLTGNKIDVTSSSYTEAWSENYTPVSSSSIVFFNYSVSNRLYRNGAADARGSIRVVVNGTVVNELYMIGAYDYGGSGAWFHAYHNVNAKAVNSNGSIMTSSYQIRVDGAQGISINESDGNSTSYLTITEVAQ